MSKWISGRLAARKLGRSHETIHRWIREGRLQPLGSVDLGEGDKSRYMVVFDRDYIDRLAADLAKATA